MNSRSDTVADRATDCFQHAYGQAPAGRWAAPGRVNLIGEHTDYNDGFVLPFALPLRTVVAATPQPTGSWTVCSELTGDAVSFGTDEVTHPGRVTSWAAYVAGVVWALREAGHAVPGARLAVASDVPLGAGLSSSAALERSSTWAGWTCRPRSSPGWPSAPRTSTSARPPASWTSRR